jgi:protein-disulfide isomerase
MMDQLIGSGRRRAALAACTVVAAFLCRPGIVDAQNTAGGSPVAVIDGVTITEAELATRVKGRLERLRSDEYTLKRAALDELLVERLLAAEAARRKTTVADLLQREVFEAVKPPLEVELRAIYENGRERYSQSEEKAFGQIRTQLMAQRVQRLRVEFIRELKRGAKIDVRLDAPRMSLAAIDSPAEGPAAAPVTIVEFSDFECPYCGQLAETLKGIRVAYRGRIRIVYRHLPLAIHANARKAAEVATCAGQQGKFWPMHDKLFESLRRVQLGDWTAMAREAGVEPAAFETCLSSTDASKAWMADQTAADGFGITGTPALFVNGRLFAGAVPYDTLADAIEDELNRSNPASP